MQRAPIFFLSLVLAAALTACSEPPSRPDPEGEHAYNADPGPSPMRSRTLKQGEPG
jgi:hypothetical protein